MKKVFSVLLLNVLLCGCSFDLSFLNQFNSSSVEISNDTSSSFVNSSSSLTVSSSNSNSISSLSSNSIPLEDPYVNMSFTTFYSNYKEATSYEDAMFRTQHGFVSGSINFSSDVPIENTVYYAGSFVKFNNYTYTYDDNNKPISYSINTKDGLYKTIYYNAAYVTLEEVAAYIYAFGEVPPNSNYSSGSSGKKASIAKWWKYGRVNIGNYSNDITRYPNEPELPLKDSKGKYYQYIETDIGLASYNNGSKITRGALRIVFTGEYQDGTKVSDVNERYVFYTYNHYEDFQEYLNYYGGWSERFGYETSGYTTPTPYEKAIIIDKNTLN